jgi:hypothetical protein
LRIPLSAAGPGVLGFYPEKTAAIGKIFFESGLMYIRNSLIYFFGKPQIIYPGLYGPRLCGNLGSEAKGWGEGGRTTARNFLTGHRGDLGAIRLT